MNPLRMLFRSAWLKSLPAAFLFACAPGAPKIIPQNEINEPVFHKTPYGGLGASQGKVWSSFDERRLLSGHAVRDMEGIYFSPRFYLDYNVNAWAGYTLLPVFWNFLLTGEQYSDSTHLALRKLNVALHAGVSGLAYSQASGWVMSGLVDFEGKYLVDGRTFLQSGIGREIYDLDDITHAINRFSAGIGEQVSERNSVILAYDIFYYDIPKRSGTNYQGIGFAAKDTRTEVTLRHTWFAGHRNSVGPEIAYFYKNLDFIRNHGVKLGLHYDYIFK
jgi:hypothetical protein